MPMLAEITAPCHPSTGVYTVRMLSVTMNVLASWLRLRRSCECWLGTNLPRFTPPDHERHQCGRTDPLCFQLYRTTLAWWRNRIARKEVCERYLSCKHGLCGFYACCSYAQWTSQTDFLNVSMVFAPQVFLHVFSGFVLGCLFCSVSSTESILWQWDTPGHCVVYTNI